MSKIQFTKMHGLGNDYVYFNCLDSNFPHPSKNSILISDRHFGIGSDGIVLIKHSEIADFKMEMYNADGSESEMCGNAVRCIAKYVYEKKLTDKTEIDLETKAGIIKLFLVLKTISPTETRVERVRVNMGSPITDALKIPTLFKNSPVLKEKISVAETEFNCTCVSMGNPHCVIFVDTITSHQVLTLGPLIENHPLFPKRINVEFAKVNSRNNVEMRVWERGSGETLACGTGACAVVVAGVLEGLLDRKVTVNLLGGNLEIELDDDNQVWKTGPATLVFDGELSLSSLEA